MGSSLVDNSAKAPLPTSPRHAEGRGKGLYNLNLNTL